MSTRQITFVIQGMYSAQCAVRLESALEQLDGVVAAHVNFASERASVVYDPTCAQTATMINAVRTAGFDTPLERVTLDVGDLIYASSAGTIERVLRRAEGVADASADLRAGRVTVAALPERASRDDFEVVLNWLGFRRAASPTSNAAAGFVVRSSLVLVMAILAALAAFRPLSVFSLAIALPPPFWLIALAALALFGTGYPFYRRALAALAQGEYDASVLIAFITFAGVSGGLVLTLIWRDRHAMAEVSAWVAFLFAAIVTKGWFVGRGLALWVLPYRRHTTLSKKMPPMPVAQSQLGVISDATRR